VDQSGSPLAQLLDVMADGSGRCIGPAAGTDEKRTFGGVLLGQGLAASARSADGLPCHSFHALFVAGGVVAEPAQISVSCLRDGRSFKSRSIAIAQGDRLILSALASFHNGDAGPEHQVAMPDVGLPHTLEDQRELRWRNAAARGRPVRRYASEEMLDARSVDLPINTTHGMEGQRYVWFRSRWPLSDDPVLHQAVIAFASDAGMVHVGTLPHNSLGTGTRLDFASLDHTIRFHCAARADGWLLHVQHSPVAVAGRGLARGTIFDAAGTLVATVTQEFLLRYAR